MMAIVIIVSFFLMMAGGYIGLWFYGKGLYYKEGLRRLESVKDIATYADQVLFWHYWDNGGGESESPKMTPLRMVYRRIFRRYEGA